VHFGAVPSLFGVTPPRIKFLKNYHRESRKKTYAFVCQILLTEIEQNLQPPDVFPEISLESTLQ